MDGEQRLMIQRINGASLEHFLQKRLAEGGGQLVDQPGNTQVVVADDGLVGIEDFSHFQSDLGFLEGTGQILDADDGGADADHRFGVELRAQGVHDGSGQLLQILRFDAGLNLLDQDDVGLTDIEDEVLLLVRE